MERGPSPTAPCWALRSPVGGTKADAADVARGPVWAVGLHSDRVRALRCPGPHRRGGADPAGVQAQHDPVRRLRLRSACGDAARALGTGAGHMGQAGGSPPKGVGQRSAEGADEPLGEGEPVSRSIQEPRCFRSHSISEAKWWSRRPAFGRSPSEGSLTCTPVALTRSSRHGYQRRDLPPSPDRRRIALATHLHSTRGAQDWFPELDVTRSTEPARASSGAATGCGGRASSAARVGLAGAAWSHPLRGAGRPAPARDRRRASWARQRPAAPSFLAWFDALEVAHAPHRMPQSRARIGG